MTRAIKSAQIYRDFQGSRAMFTLLSGEWSFYTNTQRTFILRS